MCGWVWLPPGHPPANTWSLDGSLGGQDWLCAAEERIYANDILLDHLDDFIPIFLFFVGHYSENLLKIMERVSQ